MQSNFHSQSCRVLENTAIIYITAIIYYLSTRNVFLGFHRLPRKYKRIHLLCYSYPVQNIVPTSVSLPFTNTESYSMIAIKSNDPRTRKLESDAIKKFSKWNNRIQMWNISQNSPFQWENQRESTRRVWRLL